MEALDGTINEVENDPLVSGGVVLVTVESNVMVTLGLDENPDPSTANDVFTDPGYTTQVSPDV